MDDPFPLPAPSRLFFSVGDHSGDLHGANLITALRQRNPQLVCDGFGGTRMAESGCNLLYPLCDLAVVGFTRAIKMVPTFWQLRRQAEAHLRRHRPEAVVLIDYPGFNWWMARSARSMGIPVVWYVPPQLWGWASWRVNKMRRLADHVLCSLAFEEAWYRERQVPARFLGHPYFDELARQQLDSAFLTQQRRRPGPVVAILPGSRNQELENNLTTQLQAACLIYHQRPDTRFLVACLKEDHAARVRGTVASRAEWSAMPLEVHAGRTPEVLELAHSCLAVSGSVSLELLSRGTPAVIVYRVGHLGMLLCKLLKNVPYITLVNLLADRLLFPEYVTTRCVAKEMSGDVLRWLNDEAEYRRLTDELAALRARVAMPGASERVAEYLTQLTRRAA